MAEVVLRAQLSKAGLAGRVVVDSAGTGDWHIGEQMDERAEAQLERRDYDGSAHRARQFDERWLAERDLLLAMDASNLARLRALARHRGGKSAGGKSAGGESTAPGRIRLFGEVAGLGGADVPDPYGGGPEEFNRVLDMLEEGAARLVAELRAVAGTPAAER